jgi:dTDP-glucose pyrophosphorylase
MLAGIREILIITNLGQKNLFQNILGDGSSLGIKINYK